MKVAIIGSQTFPLGDGAGFIMAAVTALGPGDSVLIRPTQGGADMMARLCANARGRRVIVYASAGPGALAFQRDIDLVTAADRVVAFFDPAHIMEGGTGHIVEVAWRMGKPVEAWTLKDGQLERVGETTQHEIHGT